MSIVLTGRLGVGYKRGMELREGVDATLRAVARAKTKGELEEVRRLAIGKTGWLTLTVRAVARSFRKKENGNDVFVGR